MLAYINYINGKVSADTTANDHAEITDVQGMYNAIINKSDKDLVVLIENGDGFNMNADGMTAYVLRYLRFLINKEKS